MNIQSIILKSKSIVEIMYQHTMTVYRNQTVVKPNGTKTTALLPVEGMSNLPCRISFTKINYDDPNKQTPTTNPIQAKPKVFCKPDIAIKAGDVVWVTVDSTKTYKGTASDCCTYIGHHLEFSLGIDTEA